MSKVATPPKRSHSLAHHKRHVEKKQQEEQLQQQQQQVESPTLTTCSLTSSPKSANVTIKPLTRSSSLTIHSRKLPNRAMTFPIPPEQQQQPQRLIKPPTRSSSLSHKKKPLMAPKITKITNNNEEELTKALLEWKHKSEFKVDWATMFSPSVKLWNDTIFGSVEEFVIHKEAIHHEQVAQSLWDETYMDKKEMAAYLGKLDPFCHNVLTSYMDRFEFEGFKLEEAFRRLCSKLYFKAEAQEIDRILESFAHKYFADNPSGIFDSADVVYAVTYSIMLLNTDLHIAQLGSSHQKMSSAVFCSNTMSTVLEQPGSSQDPEWIERLEAYLKEIYTSVKHKGILQPDEPTSFLKRIGSLKRRNTKNRSEKEQSNEPTIIEDKIIKEETLSYQIIRNNGKKPLDAEWKECRITLSKKQFSIQDNNKKFPLAHTFADVYSSTQFFIQRDESTYIIDTLNEEKKRSWIALYNYNAARESKMPLATGVNHLPEFGWEPAATKMTVLKSWSPPLLEGHTQHVSEQDQKQIITQCLDSLRKDHAAHMQAWDRIVKLFGKEGLASKNWETKASYLARNIRKLTLYQKAIIEESSK